MNELTQSTLEQITALATSEPVLTVYITADPADRARLALDLRAQRTALLESLPTDAPRTRIETIVADVARVALEHFDGRPARTQTIAGVLPVGEDQEAIWCELPEIEETTFRLGSDPYLLPILRQFELHRPSLVVLVSLDQFALLEWHAGALTEHTRQRIEIDTDEWRSRSGPFNVRAARGGGMGTSGMSTIKDQDAFDQRLHRDSVIELAAQLTTVFSADHGCDRAFWFGVPALVGGVRDAMNVPDLARQVEHIEAGAHNLLESTTALIGKQVREASIANWREYSARARHDIDAVPPARRVAGVSELHDLATEGRVAAAYIELLEEAPQSETHAASSALDAALTAILRNGGDVHIVDSLPPELSATNDHEPVASVASTLRW